LAKPSHSKASGKPDLFSSTGRDNHPAVSILSEPKAFIRINAAPRFGRYIWNTLKWTSVALLLLAVGSLIFRHWHQPGTDINTATIAQPTPPSELPNKLTTSVEATDLAQHSKANHRNPSVEENLPEPIAATIIEPEKTLPKTEKQVKIKAERHPETALPPETHSQPIAQAKKPLIPAKPKPKHQPQSTNIGTKPVKPTPQKASAHAESAKSTVQKESAIIEDKDEEVLKAILAHEQEDGENNSNAIKIPDAENKSKP
jgi:hypothetical protein